MLLEEYHAWKNNGVNIPLDDFEHYFRHSCKGKEFMDILSELAYQIFELQTCMEGLIEDAS